jgi:hypothetical protein
MAIRQFDDAAGRAVQGSKALFSKFETGRPPLWILLHAFNTRFLLGSSTSAVPLPCVSRVSVPQERCCTIDTWLVLVNRTNGSLQQRLPYCYTAASSHSAGNISARSGEKGCVDKLQTQPLSVTRFLQRTTRSDSRPSQNLTCAARDHALRLCPGRGSSSNCN